VKHFSRILLSVVLISALCANVGLAGDADISTGAEEEIVGAEEEIVGSQEEILSIKFYLERHLYECQAAIEAEDAEKAPAQTVAYGDIEKALEASDDYVDLDMALEILEEFVKEYHESPYLQCLTPVYHLYLERVNVAIVRGRKDLDEKMAEIQARLQPTAFGTFMRGGPHQTRLPRGTEHTCLIELRDNSSVRRVAWLEEVVGHHSGRLIGHCKVKHSNDKYDTHNIMISGQAEFIEKILAHYGGTVTDNSFAVNVKLVSGGWLGKTRSELIVEAPLEFDSVKSLSWIKGTVIEQGWDYIYQNNRSEIERHGKRKTIDGKDFFVVKNGELEYEVFYPHSRPIVVQKEEKSYGDLYYEAE